MHTCTCMSMYAAYMDIAVFHTWTLQYFIVHLPRDVHVWHPEEHALWSVWLMVSNHLPVNCSLHVHVHVYESQSLGPLDASRCNVSF